MARKKPQRQRIARALNPSFDPIEVHPPADPEVVEGKACCRSCALNRPCETTCNPHKPGRHGTMHLYEIEYDDPDNPGFGKRHWSTWAYDQEHAVERFQEGDEGFRPLKIARSGSARHRQKWTKLNPGGRRSNPELQKIANRLARGESR